MARLLPDILEADIAGKTVLIRADLNVPMDKGTVTDATRISRFAPTVSALTDRGAAVVIATHLGRPDREPNPFYSTMPIADALGRMLGREIRFVSDCVGQIAETVTGDLRSGDIAMLENLRFHPGETQNSRSFAVRLSVNGDLYVNDAFSCAHRAHASTHAIADIMPAYAGPGLLREVAALQTALVTPLAPVAALVGGAKVSTKITVLKNLLKKVDVLIIGGGMANTFLAAQGHLVGQSLCEYDAFDIAAEIMSEAETCGCRIILPEDVIVADAFEKNAVNRNVPVAAIPEKAMALDIGTGTRKRLAETLGQCKTLLWNGPLGAFELDPFGAGTFSVARIAADLTRKGRLVSVAGGGDTVAALNAAGVTDRFTYVSTAGGAFLEWLEGRELPGIKVLIENSEKLKEVC